MKATLATVAAGSPAHRHAASPAAPRLASVSSQRAARAAVAGTNTPIRPTRSPAAGVQLRASSSHAPGGAVSHPARTSGGLHGAAAIHAFAARGVATPASGLPHAGAIQRSFGRHDISSIQAHVGGAAAAAAAEIGADAYATGDHVVLGRGTDLFTVAHEAAHVIQQRAGVQLDGGVGVTGDRHEQHADAVAARVSAGQSAETLLDSYAGRNAAGAGFQRKTSVDTGSIQRRTSIVDDPTDAQNTIQPGSGRGLLKDSAGNIRAPGDYSFGPLRDDCGTFMEAWIDPRDYDPSGTEPKQGTWPSWWAAAAPRPNNYWVRGHLLNHNLGGPGEKRNLTPITKKANSEHHNNVEQVLKRAAQVGAGLIGYRVEALYNATGPTNMKWDATDPNRSVQSKLTLGFDCHYAILVDESTWERVHDFVDNER